MGLNEDTREVSATVHALDRIHRSSQYARTNISRLHMAECYLIILAGVNHSGQEFFNTVIMDIFCRIYLADIYPQRASSIH